MIKIKYVKKGKCRNNGIGDYFEKGKDIYILAEKFKDSRLSFAIAIHELIEQFSTSYDGIDEPLIDEFDKAFEEERQLGLHKEDDEPGMDDRSIYHIHHVFAEKIEKQVIEFLGLTWEEYCKKIKENA